MTMHLLLFTYIDFFPLSLPKLLPDFTVYKNKRADVLEVGTAYHSKCALAAIEIFFRELCIQNSNIFSSNIASVKGSIASDIL